MLTGNKRRKPRDNERQNAVIAWIMLAYLRDVEATNALPTELLYIFLRESSDMHLITICANSVTSWALKRLNTIP